MSVNRRPIIIKHTHTHTESIRQTSKIHFSCAPLLKGKCGWLLTMAGERERECAQATEAMLLSSLHRFQTPTNMPLLLRIHLLRSVYRFYFTFLFESLHFSSFVCSLWNFDFIWRKTHTFSSSNYFQLRLFHVLLCVFIFIGNDHYYEPLQIQIERLHFFQLKKQERRITNKYNENDDQIKINILNNQSVRLGNNILLHFFFFPSNGVPNSSTKCWGREYSLERARFLCYFNLSHFSMFVELSNEIYGSICWQCFCFHESSFHELWKHNNVTCFKRSFFTIHNSGSFEKPFVETKWKFQ